LIIEDRKAWSDHFEQTWLTHYRETSQVNWDPYHYVKNHQSPSTPGVELAKAKLLLISSSGVYLKDRQVPFDASNVLGDYNIRTIPLESNVTDLAFAHEHYDTTAVRKDHQVLLPIEPLQEHVRRGQLGSLHPEMISFMGYQPDVRAVVDQTIPEILEIVKTATVDAVLLVPS